MKYIANNRTEQAIIYDESQMAEAEAREIIESDYPVRDASKWEEFNILNHGKAYQIVDFAGAAKEDPEEEDWIDPIWYCYQYREGETNYDEGSWSLDEAIEDAREHAIKMSVWHVGLEENYCYDKTPVEPLYHYEIESYEEFLNFIEDRKDDKKAHYFAGDMDCFNDELETIEDIRRGVEQYEGCASWPGECYGPIYEW